MNQKSRNYEKSSEKVVVSSGELLCIDQFMLANQQLLDAVDSSDSLNDLVRQYDGVVFAFPNGEYSVYRDAQMQVLAISSGDCSKCNDEEGLGTVIEFFGPQEHNCRGVRIDTRCLAVVDASILKNKTLLEEYATLRAQGDEKAGRDLLRKQGAAVRYGFNKWGDELSLFVSTEPEALAALWPE